MRSCVLCLEPITISTPKEHQHETYVSLGVDSLCFFCMQSLPWLQQSCLRCGLPMPISQPACGTCLSLNLYRDHTLAAFEYRYPISEMISAYKFNHRLEFLPVFSQSLYHQIQQYIHRIGKPEVLIPVPLHVTRLQERGYNQSLLLVKLLSKALDIPFLNDFCSKVHETEPQLKTPATQRYNNVQSVFELSLPASKAQYKHIAIVDDVVTTGATVEALSKVCSNAGVQTISVWCIARAC